MSALVSEFIGVITVLYNFVNTNLVPTSPANVTIIHVAIWTPVVLGLLGGTVAFIKRMFGGGRRTA